MATAASAFAVQRSSLTAPAAGVPSCSSLLSSTCLPAQVIRLPASTKYACVQQKQQAGRLVRASVDTVKWPEQRVVLLRKSVTSVSPSEALSLTQQAGPSKEPFTILDVRPNFEYNEGHALPSRNAQVYRLIKNWTPWDNLRRAGFAFFGMFNGTEENPDFLEEVRSLGLTESSPIIVACSTGGTTKPSTNFPEGKQSRSLIAAYVLVMNGFTTVKHLDGGVAAWFREDLPVE